MPFKKRHPTLFQVVRIGAGILSMPVFVTLIYAALWMLFSGLHRLGMFFGNYIMGWHLVAGWDKADDGPIPWLIGALFVATILASGFAASWFIEKTMDKDE